MLDEGLRYTRWLAVGILTEIGDQLPQWHWFGEAIIPSGDTANVNGDIVLFWKNVSTPELVLNVVLLCWDVRGYRHATTYKILVVQDPDGTIGAGTEVVNGV